MPAVATGQRMKLSDVLLPKLIFPRRESVFKRLGELTAKKELGLIGFFQLLRHYRFGMRSRICEKKEPTGEEIDLLVRAEEKLSGALGDYGGKYAWMIICAGSLAAAWAATTPLLGKIIKAWSGIQNQQAEVGWKASLFYFGCAAVAGTCIHLAIKAFEMIDLKSKTISQSRMDSIYTLANSFIAFIAGAAFMTGDAITIWFLVSAVGILADAAIKGVHVAMLDAANAQNQPAKK